MSEATSGAEPLPYTVTTPFDVPSEHTAAIDKVIALAQQEILVFDRDLKDGGWGSIERASALRRFLLEHRASRLQIVVHNTAHIEGFLPRLVALLREFSHKIQILRTIEDGRNAWDAYVLVDGLHYVHRFHQNLVRGEVSTDAPNKARDLRERHDEILMFTEPGVNATQLGL